MVAYAQGKQMNISKATKFKYSDHGHLFIYLANERSFITFAIN